MRGMVRVLIQLLILVGCVTPRHWSGAAPALAAPATVTMSAISMPGVSPVGVVVNQSGARAVIAGMDRQTGQGVFVLYDLRSRRQLHRSTMPSAGGGPFLAPFMSVQVLDERRGRAYFFLLNGLIFSSVEYVVDMNTGLLLSTRPLGDFNMDVTKVLSPVVDEMSGALWLVGTRKNGVYLVRTGPGGVANGTRQFKLPGNDIHSWNALWLDPARRRVVVGAGDGDFLGFDLVGRKLWTIRTFVNSPIDALGSGRLYDPTTGDLWVEEPGGTTVSVTHITDGRQRRMKLGDVGDSSGGLLVFPGRGVFAFVLSARSISTIRLSGAPLGHTLVAALPTAQANPVFQGMAGPASLHMQLAPIIGLSAPGTLQAYYLSYQPGKFGDTDDLNLTSASRVSIFDWRTGTLLAKIKLPIVGALVSPVSSTIARGIVQVLGAGRYSPSAGAIWENWAGTALLTATIL